MRVAIAENRQEWDSFLKAQRFSPFLQSWTMGEVYRDIGQEPIRLEIREDGHIIGICQAIFVPARRGRHLMVQYGPVFNKDLGSAFASGLRTDRSEMESEMWKEMIEALKKEASKKGCSFMRMSPFSSDSHQENLNGKMSPLHLLAEHIWYLPLTNTDSWTSHSPVSDMRSPEEILMAMRKTTRNLIRRAEKDGVTVELSSDPIRDVEAFIALHDETRKRHGFTPYTNAFFRAQVKHFAPTGEALVYLAKHEGQIISTSIHMQFGGETSYHHGASTLSKVPASYLLQWRAIEDAIKREDRIYNFWGIAPVAEEESDPADQASAKDILKPKTYKLKTSNHPFAGVTLFKTGFGGTLLDLEPCFDLPLSSTYYLTRAFEYARKWKRGF